MYIGAAYPLNRIIPHLWPDNTPLPFFLAHFFLDLTNYTHDRVILRIPSVAMGVAATFVIYLLSFEITRNKKTALLAATLAAFIPTLLDLSRSFRMYALFILLSVLAAYCLLRALRTNRWWDWGAFVVCTTLNLYNHYDALFATLQLGIFASGWLATQSLLSWKFGQTSLAKAKPISLNVAAHPKQVWTRAGWLVLSFTLIGLLYLPWLPHLLAFINDPLAERGDTKVGFDFATNYEFISRATFGYDWGFWLSFPLAVAGLGWLFYRRFYYGLFTLCYFWSAWFVLTVVLHFASDTFLISPRYYCFVALVYPAMVAQGVRLVSNVLVNKLHKNIANKKILRGLSVLPPVLTVALLFFQAVQVYQTNQIYVVQHRYLDDVADFLSQNLHGQDIVLTAAPNFYAKEFRRNNIIDQTIIYIMAVNRDAETPIWSHFLDFEDLISGNQLQKLEASSARVWLLTVLDDTTTVNQTTIAKIAASANAAFEYHCFEIICLISTKTNNFSKPANQLDSQPVNQLDSLQNLMANFDYLHSDFKRQTQILEQFKLDNLTQLETVPIQQTATSYQLSTEPIYLDLPITSTTNPTGQLYYLKFNYSGSPDRILVNMKDAQGQDIIQQPNWAGYKPPELATAKAGPPQTQTDGLIFEVSSNTSKATLVLIGADLPAQVGSLALYRLKN
jgi:hypothetical protein